MPEEIVRECGDWTLAWRDGNLEARKPVPYDGVLTYTTETREYVSHRKNSRFNLTEREVVKHFIRNARPDERVSELLHDAKVAQGVSADA